MNADEIREILTSTTEEDWINSQEGAYVYKRDVRLRVQKRPIDDSDTFCAEWANKHPDHKAFEVVYDIYYGDSLVDTKMLVAVDGKRATLPIPQNGTKEISCEEYRFAKIVDPNLLDEYIEKSGLTVKMAECNLESEV